MVAWRASTLNCRSGGRSATACLAEARLSCGGAFALRLAASGFFLAQAAHSFDSAGRSACRSLATLAAASQLRVSSTSCCATMNAVIQRLAGTPIFASLHPVSLSNSGMLIFETVLSRSVHLSYFVFNAV